MKWRRGHVERRLPNYVDWSPADWGNVIADTLAGQGWATESALRHNEPGAPLWATPGGTWQCRLVKSCTFHPDAKGSKTGHLSTTGPEPWQPLHGPLNKALKAVSATRAGNSYVARRSAAREEGLAHGLTEIWDPRPHAGRGGQGDIVQNVWKLKLVWDHAGTGTVRSRPIHQQIERAEARLDKLNAVEATRLEAAAALLRCSQPRSDTVCGATIQAAVQLNEQVTSQLSQGAAQHRSHQTKRIRLAKGRAGMEPGLSRTTRGQAQRSATSLRAIAVAELARAADEEASEQARGPEGRQTLHDRCVEAREAADQLLTAISSQDPGFFELARDELGLWRHVTEDRPANHTRPTTDRVL